MSSNSDYHDHDHEREHEHDDNQEDQIGGEGLTETDLKRMQQWTATPAPHPNQLLPGRRNGAEVREEPGPKRSGAVDADQCAEWRQRAGEGADLDDLAEEAEVRRRVVGYHLRGRCSCQRDTPALVYQGGEWVKPRKTPRVVTERQCAEWRRRVLEGESSHSLAKSLDLTPSAVYHHIAGRCSCQHEQPPLTHHEGGGWVEDEDGKGSEGGEHKRPRESVSAETCAEWRELALSGQSSAEIAAKYDMASTTVGDHLRGERLHNPGVTVPPLAHDGAKWVVDREQKEGGESR